MTFSYHCMIDEIIMNELMSYSFYISIYFVIIIHISSGSATESHKCVNTDTDAFLHEA